MDTLQMLDMVLKYLIIPVGGWAAVQFSKLNTTLQAHATELAVLKAQVTVMEAFHAKEMNEIRAMDRRIFDKLDSIEEALRK